VVKKLLPFNFPCGTGGVLEKGKGKKMDSRDYGEHQTKPGKKGQVQRGGKGSVKHSSSGRMANQFPGRKQQEQKFKAIVRKKKPLG